MVYLFMLSHQGFDVIPKVDDLSDAWFMSNYAKKLFEDERRG